METYTDIFADKERVLFVTAHPDDVDAFFGGTIAQLTDDNKEVYVVVVTSGARGSRDKEISEAALAKIREQEQTASLQILGVQAVNVSFLGNKDGEIVNDYTFRGDIVREIRRIQPEVICTHEPQGNYFKSSNSDRYYVNHWDHRTVGAAVTDAVYPFSRDRSFYPEHYADDLEPYTVEELVFTGDTVVNMEVEINIEQKKKALQRHESQFDLETVDRILGVNESNTGFKEQFHYVRLF